MVLCRKNYDLQDDVIVWGNRFDGQPDMNDIKFDCMISTDCTNCHCDESYPASPDMYLENFNGPGLKYEAGVCIKTGYICLDKWPNSCRKFRANYFSRRDDATVGRLGAC